MACSGKQWLGGQCEVGYNGGDFSTGITFANVNPVQQTGIVVANYLQKLGTGFTLGAEYMYQSAQGREQPQLTFAGRYRNDATTRE